MVLFHKFKKLNGEDWADAVNAGKLTAAIKSLKPARANGPWRVICDNETFLRGKPVMAAYRKAKVHLWKIPKRSPDLNPVEKFWAWLRKKLRGMDLADAVAQRPVLGKMAFRERVRRVVRTKKAQEVATNCAKGLRKVCCEVIRKRGNATKG